MTDFSSIVNVNIGIVQVEAQNNSDHLGFGILMLQHHHSGKAGGLYASSLNVRDYVLAGQCLDALPQRGGIRMGDKPKGPRFTMSIKIDLVISAVMLFWLLRSKGLV